MGSGLKPTVPLWVERQRPCELKVDVMVPPPLIGADLIKDRGVLNISCCVAIVAPVVANKADDLLDRGHPHVVKNDDAVRSADRVGQEEIDPSVIEPLLTAAKHQLCSH